MNNGVENNQTVEPVLTPIGDNNAVPTMINTDVNVNTVAAGTEGVTPAAPVYNTPEVPTMVTADVNQPTTPEPIMVDQAVAPTPEGANTQPETTEEKPKKEKKKGSPGGLLIILLLLAVGAAFYFKTSGERTAEELNYKCTPTHERKEDVELDVNSTLVKDLYQKVATSINEDFAQPEWNDNMKLYLAYRQIPEHAKYDSNCNMFKNYKMEPYTCEVSVNFVPKAFTRETLELEWKKLYGENTPMPAINVKLENDCVGGFEYIPEREEYVQGYCKQQKANAFKVSKKIVKAVSSKSTIVLRSKI